MKYLNLGLLFFVTSSTACFGPTNTLSTPGGLAGEGEICTGIDPSTANPQSSDLVIEMGQGRTKVEFQPYIDEDRLELSQGAQGMAMIVYDIQVQANNISGNGLCATIVVSNNFSTVNSEDYIPMRRMAYVLERDDNDFFAGPIYHPFGWNTPNDYETESFRMNLRVFVGDKVGSISRDFELIDDL